MKLRWIIANVWIVLLSAIALYGILYNKPLVFIICCILAWSFGYRLLEKSNGHD